MTNEMNLGYQFQGNWFCEDDPETREDYGDAISLKMKELLYHQKSEFQDIAIFESTTYGKVLVLDDLLQLTERDEFIYHEMIAHLPMFSHPCPKSVLVVGGGDGGTLREVAKHSTAEEIHICEIDEAVIKVCKQYLRQTAVGFDSPKVTEIIQDAMEYLRNTTNRYDVIITDCSDPVGPAEALYERSFVDLIHGALKEDGIWCMQGQSVWNHFERDMIKNMLKICKDTFEVTTFATAWIPSFGTGQIGFILASKNKETSFENPRIISEDEIKAMSLQFYDNSMHKASLCLPRFLKKGLNL